MSKKLKLKSVLKIVKGFKKILPEDCQIKVVYYLLNKKEQVDVTVDFNAFEITIWSNRINSVVELFQNINFIIEGCSSNKQISETIVKIHDLDTLACWQSLNSANVYDKRWGDRFEF